MQISLSNYKLFNLKFNILAENTKMAASRFKVALIQMLTTAEKSVTLKNALSKIKEAAVNGAQLVILPESFNAPYGNQYFKEYSEPFEGQTFEALSKASSENKIWLVGGSFIEKSGESYFNTSTAFNPSGKLVAKHQKLHLFDIDVPGKITFKESDTLTAGNSFTTFDTDWCKVGLGICYDIRFSEMSKIYANLGCKLLIYPGCFNMTTGPAHWELLARATAVNNQVFAAVCSQARDDMGTYIAWGHSMVVDPWGTILSEADAAEEILYADIDLAKLDEVRSNIPVTIQQRKDLYQTVFVPQK